MAEFVQRRYEEMLPELEQIESIKLLEKRETREIAKKRKNFEYRLQSMVKRKEDYVSYIQYEMNILQLLNQRRRKFGVTSKKTTIESAINQRVHRLYKEAIMRFRDEFRFWSSHIKFLKSARLKNLVGPIITQMLQSHSDSPKAWHIAAMWEKEENADKNGHAMAKKYLLNGLKIHPSSEILYMDLFRLELENSKKVEDEMNCKEEADEENVEMECQEEMNEEVDVECKEKTNVEMNEKIEEKTNEKNDKVPKSLKLALIVYQHALRNIKDVSFFIELLKMMEKFSHARDLQKRILSDLLEFHGDKPLTWDYFARRELAGALPQPCYANCQIDIDSAAPKSYKMRIFTCNEVYQAAVKRIPTEEMWSLYTECMIEINTKNDDLPNFKKKFLKHALTQGHELKRLAEKYYMFWIQLLNNDECTDDTKQAKISEVLSCATDAFPQSVKLWNERLKYVLSVDHENAAQIFQQANGLLGPKALTLWKTNLLFFKSQYPEKLEEFYEASLRADPVVANSMKSDYIMWLVVTKGIEVARVAYASLSQTVPFSMRLHNTMIEMELAQANIVQEKLRNIFEKAIIQFGTTNVKIWEQYMDFELKHGNIGNIGLISKKATNTLESPFREEFTRNQTLKKANKEIDNIQKGMKTIKT